MTSPETAGKRHQNLHAHHVWQQQRFFAGFMIAAGLLATGYFIYQRQALSQSTLIWSLYIPIGLMLGGGLLLYRWRSHVRVLDSGVRISTTFSGVLIDYDSIRLVRALPLRTHFQDRRSRMIVPIMKQYVDKPALFIRLRGDEAYLAAIKKKLGSRLMFEDTIAIPVPDADALAWEIAPHLPERIGQNLGGKRRKRRR